MFFPQQCAALVRDRYWPEPPYAFGVDQSHRQYPGECPPQPIPRQLRRLGNAALCEAAHWGCSWPVRDGTAVAETLELSVV
jgi:hypothetical protein